MKPTLVIFGDRTANEVQEAAQLGYGDHYSTIHKLYFEKETFLNEQSPRISQESQTVHFIVGAANMLLKKSIADLCTPLGWTPVSIVHPTAVIAPSAKVGHGSFIGPLAVVSSHAVVGEHVIVHIHSSVGHDVRVGDYCAILPGARLSGKVDIGHRTMVGSNAFVAAGVRVGNDCRVDALTYLHHDLPDGHIVSPRAKKPMRRVDL